MASPLPTLPPSHHPTPLLAGIHFTSPFITTLSMSPLSHQYVKEPRVPLGASSVRICPEDGLQAGHWLEEAWPLSHAACLFPSHLPEDFSALRLALRTSSSSTSASPRLVARTSLNGDKLFSHPPTPVPLVTGAEPLNGELQSPGKITRVCTTTTTITTTTTTATTTVAAQQISPTCTSRCN